MAISSIVSEIKQDVSRKSRFFILHLHSTSLLKWGGGRRTMVVIFGVNVAYATAWC